MKKLFQSAAVWLLLATLNALLSTVFAQGTAFTYQGQLQNNGSLANGTYNLTFTLFTNITGGSAVAGPLTNNAVGVTNGLFSVTMDFGSSDFNGQTNWLQIAVETNGAGSFTNVSPRQKITPAPYAIYAETANGVSGTVSASQISGSLPSANLSGTYGGLLNLTNSNNSFTGNGGGLTNLNTTNLVGTLADARLSTNVALLNANQTFTGVNTFAGASQGLIVNGGPIGTNLFTGLGMQYDPGSGEAAIISSLNDNRSFLTFYTKQGAGVPPVQQMKIDRNGVVMIDDQANNDGVLNDGTTNGASLVFGGNSGEGIASQRTPGLNQYGLDFYTGRIHRMSILNNGNVGIGTTNPGTAFQVSGTVNATAFAGDGSAVVNLNASQLNSGTVPNSVLSSFQGNYSTVGGGNGNSAGNNEATVGGGLNNTASGQESTVMGGNNNQATGQYSTVPGGDSDLASGKWSYAAGRQAQATNQGAFVWADSQNAPFTSTNRDSFNVRAQGGAFFATSGAGITVDGQPVLTGANLSGTPGTAVWQVASGTLVQAQSNTGYLLANSKQVTVTLPASPNVGDVVEVFDSGAGGWMVAQNASQSILYGYESSPGTWVQHAPSMAWSCIASSADGTKLAAAAGYPNATTGSIYTSTDSGATWQPTSATNLLWSGIASSSDGTKLVAVTRSLFGQGSIYTSTDSGATWTLNAPGNGGNAWSCVASSADGSHLAAGTVSNGGQSQIYISTNSGASWSLALTTSYSLYFLGLASSSDGSTLAGVLGGGQSIFVSTNSGANWTQSTPGTSLQWSAIACSSDGRHVVAAAQFYEATAPGGLYVSANAGATWTLASGSTNASWTSVASSADGSYLAATADYEHPGGGIYTSTDFGTTWSLTTAPTNNYYVQIASSSDGTKLAAPVEFNASSSAGKIWTSGTANSPLSTTAGTFGYLGGRAGSGVKLVYAGNGQFVVVNQHGSIYGL